jgi:hypothetical protein
MPDVNLGPIEPLIVIVLARVCGSAPAIAALVGVSSLDLGRLWQRRRPFFLYAPIGSSGPGEREELRGPCDRGHKRK